MPSPQGMRQAIRSRIKTRLIDEHPEIEWILREDAQRAPGVTQSHVIIDILPARSSLVASGNPRLFRTRGTLVFRIATPLSDGAGPNEAIAELITPHYRALLDTDVSPPVRYYFRDWSPSEVPDETWLVTRLVVEWDCDFNEPM